MTTVHPPHPPHVAHDAIRVLAGVGVAAWGVAVVTLGRWLWPRVECCEDVGEG